MKQYSTIRDGIVVGNFTAPDHVGEPVGQNGETFVEGLLPINSRLVMGEFVSPEPEVVTGPAQYREARKSAYPPVTEQLDMLFKAMLSGALPRAEPFFSVIQGIKAQYPKTAASSSENEVIL